MNASKKQVLIWAIGVGLLGALVLALFILLGTPGSLAPPDIDDPHQAADLGTLPTAESVGVQVLNDAQTARPDLKVIKASDYSVQFASAQGEHNSVVEFYGKDGLLISNYRSLAGDMVADARNMLWGQKVDVKISSPVKELQGRQVALVTTEESLTRPDDLLKGISLLYVEGDVVVEALNVTLLRSWKPRPGDKKAAIEYKGNLMCRWTTPVACELQYTLDGLLGVIRFDWDNEKKNFVDLSSDYPALKGKLRK